MFIETQYFGRNNADIIADLPISQNLMAGNQNTLG